VATTPLPCCAPPPPRLATQAKLADLALPAGFCNDLAFDSAGNLFATVNNFTASTERIYKLSASTVASGSATAANWAPWYTAPTGFKVNGLAYDATNSRLLWADNSATLGGTFIQASATAGAAASASAVISSLAVNVDGLQINNKGNLVAIDTTTGAKLVNLATGTPGTVTNLTDGAACSTTVAIYKADAWCSDSRAKVIRLVGAGDL
jgi:sugar lactone lactonase YvrE